MKTLMAVFHILLLSSTVLRPPVSVAQGESIWDSLAIYDNLSDITSVFFINDNNNPEQQWAIGNNLFDVVGLGSNEFSIVDYTAGTGPFAIYPGAPNQSLVISPDGNILIGAGRLGVVGDSPVDDDVQVYVENANSAAFGTVKKLFVIKNNGAAKFSMISSDTDEWAFNALNNAFRISKQGSGNVEMEVTETGNLKITGTLTQGSSRSIKHSIVDVDVDKVLDKVIRLPITTWSYNADVEGVKHLGPMSEDFYQAFGLGETDKGLTSIDTAGVALAAIQGLHLQIQKKDGRLSEQAKLLESQSTRLNLQEQRIQQLEKMIAELMHESNGEYQVVFADYLIRN